MAHRDDHDAALARAAALTRDLRRARAEAKEAEARAAKAEARAAEAEARARASIRATSVAPGRPRPLTPGTPPPATVAHAAPLPAARGYDAFFGLTVTLLAPIGVAAVVYLLTR